MNPKLAQEWHPTLNGVLKPTDVGPYSNKQVWWCCSGGHEWKALVSNRSKGNGCPYCSGKRIIPGKTDLATLRPDLAAEWHPTRNGALNPTEISVHSNKNVYWRCKKGHEWQAAVGLRTRGHTCPYCSGRPFAHRNKLSKN